MGKVLTFKSENLSLVWLVHKNKRGSSLLPSQKEHDLQYHADKNEPIWDYGDAREYFIEVVYTQWGHKEPSNGL